MLALLCLWPLQTWLVSYLADDALTPYEINLSLPLSDELNQHYGLSAKSKILNVFVSGSFSDWRSDDPFYQMHSSPDNQSDEKQWQYLLPIYPGDIEYKLALDVEGQDQVIWILDPKNPNTAVNPWGDKNSLIEVADWPKIAVISQLLTLAVIGAFLLYCLLEPLLYWLLHLKMPLYRKLVLSNVLILICVQIIFFSYQLHQNRQLIKLSISDTLHNMHLVLASNQINFDDLNSQKDNIDIAIDQFFSPATTRIDKKQTSLFQITLSDFAVLDKNGELISLHHRQQNQSLQLNRAQKLGFNNTDDYFIKGMWASLIPQAKQSALNGQLITAKRPSAIRHVETNKTRQSEWVLGFSQVMQPIVSRGQLQGFYGGSIQVKLYGAELLNTLLFQLLLLTGVLSLASWLLMSVGKIVTADILTLTNWTQRIVKGDLTQKLKLNSQDEIQQLGDNFELMRESLASSFHQIEQQNSKLYQEAYFNNLTGLPNRKKLYADLNQHTVSSLLVFNITDFAEINDFYGVKTGDAIIQKVANTFEMNAAPHRLYKTGADEFVVLVAIELNDQQLQQLAEQLIDHVSHQAIVIDDNELYVTLSAGGAHRVNDQYSQLHQQADLARRIARRQFQRYRLFTSEMSNPEAFEANMHQSRLLVTAVQNNLVTPYVQLIKPLSEHIESDDSMSVNPKPKFECLMRICLPDGTVLAPGQFMQTAVRSRLYPRMMKVMLEKSFLMFEPLPYEFSVNISLEDIADAERVETLLSLLKTYPETATRLTFELLESEEITNYDLVHDFIVKVKPYGCKIAIDDFGAGYSNFVHLMRLDIDIIKIDGSLIRHLDKDTKAQHLVSTVTSFAQKMAIETVAEFVDSEQVLEQVKHYNIDYAQGYLLGKPAPTIKAALALTKETTD
ncbi:EAL domain-containing protein [Shewanella olleyana]|uniref:EAL domain-containing protein n=1 Tax=Shewanella olleyana TaxID=135626 RepID=UPI00200CF25A|nr:EAL domain-containing protein [Shewanella olleyana]MCL1067598.1 EAL domain-containing protein [Shewanella olleyana]